MDEQRALKTPGPKYRYRAWSQPMTDEEQRRHEYEEEQRRDREDEEQSRLEYEAETRIGTVSMLVGLAMDEVAQANYALENGEDPEQFVKRAGYLLAILDEKIN